MAEGGFGTAPAKVSEAIAPNPTGTAGPTPAVNSQNTFDAKKSVPKQSDSSLAVNSTTRKVRLASERFFLVAGLSLMEAVFFSSSDVTLAAACGVVTVMFGILGAFTYRLNKMAVLAGTLTYIAETMHLLVHGWNTTMIIVGYAVFVHCAILYRLYLTYGMICDLETAET